MEYFLSHPLMCFVVVIFRVPHQPIVMKLGIEAITLPVDVAAQMFAHPAVQPAVDQFDQDWKGAFGDKLSFES